jgi:hypothetical protein
MHRAARISAETKIDTAITVSTRSSRAAKKEAQKEADSNPVSAEPCLLELLKKHPNIAASPSLKVPTL